MSNLIRWSPVRDVAAMQNAMDRLFDDAWRGFGSISGGNVLALDVFDKDDVYEVVVNLPGFEPEQIDVTINEDVLSIVAEQSYESRDEDTKTLLQERVYGKFSRQITLPTSINADAVDSHFENGVLTLTLPKADAQKRRRIPIRMPKLING